MRIGIGKSNGPLLNYYKLLKEIYDIIIVNWNTSVANVFIMFFGRDGSITKSQLREFFKQQVMADVKSIEKHGYTFDEFFDKFFDPKLTGHADLASILTAFHDTIEIKVSFEKVILI